MWTITPETDDVANGQGSDIMVNWIRMVIMFSNMTKCMTKSLALSADIIINSHRRLSVTKYFIEW
jgi:hypothetical protein